MDGRSYCAGCVLTNLPNTPTNTQRTYINISSASGDIVYYKYRLDVGTREGTVQGPYTADSPIALSALPEGEYTIRVMGIDAAGNTESVTSCAVWKWTIDITSPIATLTGLPNSITKVNDLLVSVGGSGVVKYRYRIPV